MRTGLRDRPHEISGERFATYGILSLAYVKRAVVEGHSVYAVHAANGEYLWHYADEEVARAALLQQDMQPARVH